MQHSRKKKVWMLTLIFLNSYVVSYAQSDKIMTALKSLGEPLCIESMGAPGGTIAALVESVDIVMEEVSKNGLAALPDAMKSRSKLSPKNQFTVWIQVKSDMDINKVKEILGKEDSRETKDFLTRDRTTSKFRLPSSTTFPEGYRYGVAQRLEKQEEGSDPIVWYRYSEIQIGAVDGKVKIVKAATNPKD